MKKYLSLSIVLLLTFVVNIPTIRAENEQEKTEDESSKIKTELGQKKDEIRVEMNQKIEIIRKEAKQKMEDLKVKIKGEKDEVKAKIKEVRITGRENTLKKFDATIEKINNLKERVNAQITKFEAKGVDVANAKSFATTAETKLIDAKNKIAEINTLLVASVNELSKTSKAKLKILTKDTQTLIVEVNKALKDATKSLKNATKSKIETEKNNKNTEDSNQ